MLGSMGVAIQDQPELPQEQYQPPATNNQFGNGN
jgi:hypothetical protein